MGKDRNVDVAEVTVFGLLVMQQVAPSCDASVAVDDESVLVEQDRIDLLMRRVLEILPQIGLPREIQQEPMLGLLRIP